MDIEELKHHYRIIDMLLSMHSKIRDENQRLALLCNLFLLFSSVILGTFVFIDPDLLRFLRINPQVAQVIVGICSTVVFLISLIELRVDWKEKAERHSGACEVLAKLKADCRELLKVQSQPNPQDIAEQCRKCAQSLASLPKIPDKRFHSLKAYHQSKIELSMLIDAHPGAPVWLLRIVLFSRGLKSLLRK